ncbi:phage tail protein [Chimaeribacter arupi]|uniref:phage tail protein n=1 Tax=Chimaeribacter arupi TaxID=2060066 RepID=UPI00294784E8|nr:phage tail protein [Chimaeribacter arupi]MDV5140860.1 phage tail protein [Chimaeribacter arupi]
MADTGLSQPVIVQATRLDATVLPAGFSQAFLLYLIQQGQDFGNVASKANEAGQGAYDAQERNEEQDLKISDHEQRLEQNEVTLQEHEQRISGAELAISDHEQRIAKSESDITALTGRLDTAEQGIADLSAEQTLLTERVTQAEADIDDLQNDSVSKSDTSTQVISSPISVNTSYSVNGTKVVGERVTGFTAATGTALKGAFDASATFTVSATYTQAEVQALATALVAARQRIKALEDAMRSHGLIN